MTTYLNQTTGGSITRSQTGEIDVKLSLYRDGRRVEDSSGNYDLISFLRGFEIYESIANPCMEARLVLEDAGGVIGSLTGSEEIRLEIKGSIVDRSYFFRSYHIQARVRTNQSNETYLINCVSDEYIKNEVVNIFGNSETVFGAESEASNIIRKILTKELKTKKKLFLEKTINKQSFISPNWRPFDLIYWMSQRCIRKGKGGQLQNAFAFFENAMGFNFKSLDSMIDAINEGSDVSNPTTGDMKTYQYTYTPKRMTGQEYDQFNIERITFPDERNYLMGLRHGAWSGFSVGFDPTFITRSRMGLSTDLSADAYRYAVTEIWKKMSHLNGKGAKNPFNLMDKSIQEYVRTPKRVRYTMIPNQIFDPKFQNNPQRNYEQLVELQAYQWMRLETLKNTRLTIQVPGNLDLYAGGGIDIRIPANEPGTQKIDERYSGRYLIAAVAHKATGFTMTTELSLMKDSFGT